MNLRGWTKMRKRCPGDPDSWRNKKFGCIVAKDTNLSIFYYYGGTVNNSLWTGRSWPTPELAAHHAEAAALAVIDHAKRTKP